MVPDSHKSLHTVMHIYDQSHTPSSLSGLWAINGSQIQKTLGNTLGSPYSVRFGSDRTGLVRFGSDLTGLVRFGSDRFGSVRFGSVRFGSDRIPNRTGSDRFGSDWTASLS